MATDEKNARVDAIRDLIAGKHLKKKEKNIKDEDSSDLQKMNKISVVLMVTTIFCLPACGGRLPASVSTNSASQASTASNTTSPSAVNTPIQTPASNTASYPQVQQIQQASAYAQNNYSQPRAMPTPPPSVQIRPDLYANPYYPQSYGQRPTGPAYPGQAAYPNMSANNAYPQNQAYAASYNNQPRRSY